MHYAQKLFPIGENEHVFLPTINSLFQKLQFEFRKDLTQKNFSNYIHYYNVERKREGLADQIPANLHFRAKAKKYIRVIEPLTSF